MKKAYEAPVVRVVGSVRDLTLTVTKNSNNQVDGFAFQGAALTS